MKARLSMRTVLWLVAIMAILAAWLADHRRLVGEVNNLRDELTRSRAEIAALDPYAPPIPIIRGLIKPTNTPTEKNSPATH